MDLLFIGVGLIILGIFLTPFAIQSVKLDKEELEVVQGWRRVAGTIFYIVGALTISSITGWLMLATLACIGGGIACIIYFFM